MANGQISVQFTNTLGDGYAKKITVVAGTTAGQLLADKVQGADPSKFMLRVNNVLAPPDRVLADGDRMEVFPHKIVGGAR